MAGLAGALAVCCRICGVPTDVRRRDETNVAGNAEEWAIHEGGELVDRGGEDAHSWQLSAGRATDGVKITTGQQRPTWMEDAVGAHTTPLLAKHLVEMASGVDLARASATSPGRWRGWDA